MPKCTGHSSQTGKPCDAWAVQGLSVCIAHGAAPEHARAAGRRNVATAKAKKVAIQLGIPVEIDPQAALLGELWRTNGYVLWLEAQGAGEPSHGWSWALREERQHLARLAMGCLRAKIEERQIKLAEQQGKLIAGLITGMLSDLGVDPKSEKARRVVRKHLTAIAGGAA